MGEFGPEPGREGSRVGTSNCDPFVAGRYSVPFVFFDFLDKVSDVLEGLLRVEILHIIDLKGCGSKGQRITVVPVFECNDEPVSILGESGCPALICDSIANALSADVEQDGSVGGFEVGAIDEISLFPELRGNICEVIDDLIKVLNLLTGESIFSLCLEGVVEFPCPCSGN